jgi:SAM-dependent methyltransferase
MISSTAHKNVDAASYDATAAAFEPLTDRYATPLAKEMLKLAQVGPASRVLDVGTGTGLVALQLARDVIDSRIVGIDHSHGMLLRASMKARHQGLGERLTFARMDAEALGLADSTFDIVFSLFVLFHLPNPLAAIKDFRRVLRPGGRVVIGIGRGPRLLSRVGFEHALRRLAAQLAAARGRMLVAPGFLAELMQEKGLWPEQEHVMRPSAVSVPELLRQAGFKDLSCSWHGRWAELDAEEFWNVQVTYSSTERIRLAELQPDQLDELRTEFLKRCNRVLARGGRLVYPYGAMFYAARS